MKIGRPSSPASTDSARSAARPAEAKESAAAPVATSAPQAVSVGRGVRGEATDALAHAATAAADEATVDASRARTAGVENAAKTRILKASELTDTVTPPARGLDVHVYRKRGSGKEM
jgi:hypothetical protein